VAHKAVQVGARGEAGSETWVAVTGVESGAAVIRGHVGALREGTSVRFTQGSPSPLPPTPEKPQAVFLGTPEASPASGRGSKSPSP
jgi:hypothetical protein